MHPTLAKFNVYLAPLDFSARRHRKLPAPPAFGLRKARPYAHLARLARIARPPLKLLVHRDLIQLHWPHPARSLHLETIVPTILAQVCVLLARTALKVASPLQVAFALQGFIVHLDLNRIKRSRVQQARLTRSAAKRLSPVARVVHQDRTVLRQVPVPVPTARLDIIVWLGQVHKSRARSARIAR